MFSFLLVMTFRDSTIKQQVVSCDICRILDRVNNICDLWLFHDDRWIMRFVKQIGFETCCVRVHMIWIFLFIWLFYSLREDATHFFLALPHAKPNGLSRQLSATFVMYPATTRWHLPSDKCRILQPPLKTLKTPFCANTMNIVWIKASPSIKNTF
jgi:hypothetical protein